jgi:hypothetical protein
MKVIALELLGRIRSARIWLRSVWNIFVYWMKQTGGMRKARFRGFAKVAWHFLMTAAAFNLWRLPKIQTA